MSGPYVTYAEDGTLVLVDPDAAGVVEATAKDFCKKLLAANADRVAHFYERSRAYRAQGQEVCFVLLDTEDSRAAMLIAELMPGHTGHTGHRFARGLVNFDGMVSLLEAMQEGMSSAWTGAGDDDLPVVVMSAGAVLVTTHRGPRGAR